MSSINLHMDWKHFTSGNRYIDCPSGRYIIRWSKERKEYRVFLLNKKDAFRERPTTYSGTINDCQRSIERAITQAKISEEQGDYIPADDADAMARFAEGDESKFDQMIERIEREAIKGETK